MLSARECGQYGVCLRRYYQGQHTGTFSAWYLRGIALVWYINIWLVYPRARRLSQVSRSSKVPERWPPREFCQANVQAEIATSAFSSLPQRARASSEARHVETKYQHRAHRICDHHQLHPRRFTPDNTIISSDKAGPLTCFIPLHQRAERRLSGLRQGVLRKIKALPLGLYIFNGGQLRQ